MEVTAMVRRVTIYAVAALLFLLGIRLGTMWQTHAERQRSALPATVIPTRQSSRPDERLAPTLPPSDFPRNPVAQHAYYTAALIEPLLEKLPCDAGSAGHAADGTLLSCFQDRQAAHCPACLREDYYAYTESRDGENAREIRQGILEGAWKDINLSKWDSPLLVKIAADR
jgi:hypothetical protein